MRFSGARIRRGRRLYRLALGAAFLMYCLVSSILAQERSSGDQPTSNSDSQNSNDQQDSNDRRNSNARQNSPNSYDRQNSQNLNDRQNSDSDQQNSNDPQTSYADEDQSNEDQGTSRFPSRRRAAASDDTPTRYSEDLSDQSTTSEPDASESDDLPDRALLDRQNRNNRNNAQPGIPSADDEQNPPSLSGDRSARNPLRKMRTDNSQVDVDQNSPLTTKVRNPYRDLPSLDDLYRKIPSKQNGVKRFGADIFRNGTGNLEKLPMDLPAGPDYLLGPGDGVSINIRGSVSRTIAKAVNREGRIILPEAGMVVVAGQTIAQAQELIEKAFSTQYRDIKVDISLTRLRTIRIYVVGDVERPGAFDISALSTPLNALFIAGGPTARGSLRSVRIYRGEKLIRGVDLYDLLLQGVRSAMERLEPGDTVLVPPVGAQVTVAGMVRRPAVYELNKETNLAEVLQLAGGVLVSANLQQIRVERIEAHQRRLLVNVSGDPTDAHVLSKALNGFTLQDGDYVTLSPILPYSDETVYLNGHVFRPGKYPYHSGMQISELIRSYQDLLPEPSDRAQIIRLVPPDYHPEAIEFKLSEVLGGDDPIDLQPFDTIRILGRYEADPPNVFVYGEVLRPGKYPLAQGMTAAGLVRMAGGVTRSAFTQEADVASYVVRNGSDVVTKHATFEIGKALTGEKAADLALKPNDVLTVRKLTGWDDIGASVTINGQVLYPGRFGIEDGEKLSSLLLQAGGFRDNAYPEGAVLERLQVRELAEKSRAQLISRIETVGATPHLSATASAQEQASMLQTRTQQQQQVLTALRNQRATGRLVINITTSIRSWKNTASDIELRPGDIITIPRKPSFVLVNGQVYNPTALTFVAGKSASWYLNQAGGPSELASKKDIYIIRASGSVIGRNSHSLWTGGLLNTVMHAGDTVVVPEKVFGDSHVWKDILDTAQLTTSLAIAARVATSF